MHIELRHLRTIKAIHDTGSVAGAADFLNITQSALSHQIKAIEEQVRVELFVRRSKPLRLSAAGLRMLAAAERILPEFDALQAEFAALRDGSLGRLYVGVENAACHDWVLPVLERFGRVWPQLDLDLRVISNDPLAALRHEDVDMVLTLHKQDLREITFVPLFDFELLLLVSDSQEKTKPDIVNFDDLEGHTLFSYPSNGTKEWDLTRELSSHGVVLEARRDVSVSEMMLMLCEAGQGGAVVPDWILPRLASHRGLKAQRIGEGGLTRRMFAAVRTDQVTTPHIAYMIRLLRQDTLRLQQR